jgi:hypothetical protein
VPKLVGKQSRSMNRKRRHKSRTVTNATFTRPPNDLASLIRGLYRRVARQLEVDPSYVSRVARGERQSRKIEDALKRELNKIVQHIKTRRGVLQKAALKKKRKRANKNTDEKV